MNNYDKTALVLDNSKGKMLRPDLTKDGTMNSSLGKVAKLIPLTGVAGTKGKHGK